MRRSHQLVSGMRFAFDASEFVRFDSGLGVILLQD